MSQEIALLKESRNRIAIRHGLPPVGAVMVNQYGIKWLVDGHLFVPTLSTIARHGVDHGDCEDPNDLYPVILPQNLSPRLTEFIAETDRCTSKQIMPLDTMPHLRPQDAHPYGFSVDGLTSPHRIVLFLDAVHIHETVLAHEIGHIWIDLVDDCEDYRMLKDLSNTVKVFQWYSLQSFVLDNKVNAVLREKGFDMSVIEEDVNTSLASFAAAILSGYRPPTAHEAAFVASTLATAMLDDERGEQETLQNLELAAMVFQRDLPEVYHLACGMAASIRRHGYSDRASIGRAIDECARLSFTFLGEPFDPDRELIEERPTEAYQDKYPEYFAGLPVPAKLEIGKAMARMKIPAGSECRLSYTPGGSVQVQFCEASGTWTPPVMLHHASRIPNDVFSRGQRPMQKGSVPMQQPVHPAPMRNVPLPGVSSVVSPSSLVASQNVFSGLPLSVGASMRRTYAPGLARFLSQVRLEEQLGGEHPYGYAFNNPVTYNDPSGFAPCAICCCQINSATQTWKLIPANDPGHWGHILTTTVSMSNVPSDHGGTCSLKWYEKTDLPYARGQKKDTWQDVCTLPVSCPEDTFNKKVPKGCPEGPNTWQDIDPPGLAKTPHRTAKRMLCIKVVVTDGCSGHKTVLRFNQYIEVSDGKLVVIVPPANSKRLQEYCSK